MLTTSFTAAPLTLLCEEDVTINPTLQMGKLRRGDFRNVPFESSPAVTHSLPQAAAGRVSLLHFIVVITIIIIPEIITAAVSWVEMFLWCRSSQPRLLALFVLSGHLIFHLPASCWPLFHFEFVCLRSRSLSALIEITNAVPLHPHPQNLRTESQVQSDGFHSPTSPSFLFLIHISSRRDWLDANG